MPRQVTVNLFDVSSGENTPRLSDVIAQFSALPLDRRWRDDIRLDNIVENQVEGRRMFYLDFAKKREIGPGKLANNTAINDIDLARNENFGEETAALYVPHKKWLLILHNQTGVGPNRMMTYFNALDPGNAHYDYAAEPIIDAQVMRQLTRLRSISSVEVTATIDSLQASARDVGVAMARAVRPMGTQRISFSLMANVPYKKDRTLDLRAVKDFLRALKGGDPDAVTALRVKGDDPEDDTDKDILIDLIRHRLKQKFRDDELVVVNHRYTIDSRWALLTRSYRRWHNIL
jgi:hypothetical protein